MPMVRKEDIGVLAIGVWLGYAQSLTDRDDGPTLSGEA